MDGLREKLAGVVGGGNVADDAATLERYARDGSFAAPMPPRFVVKVKSAEEVQGVVRVANETRTPLVPVSSAGPRRRGDTVPSVPEAVVVDLSGMKRIISVNRQQRVAVVEPGVTYAELAPALAREGLELSLPLAPREGKSVVASVLDMEPRMNALHQWNFIDPLRCTEVVWGDGNRMYTGEAGGGPLDIGKQQGSERWQVSGTGPMMLDFYRLLTGSQGTMGIVTWASLKCETVSSVRRMYVVPAARAEDLVDFVYRVTRLRLGCEMMVVNASTLAGLLGGDHGSTRAGLPAWAALVGVSGQGLLPEMRAEGQALDISEIAGQFGLKMVPALAGIHGSRILAAVSNPSGPGSWKDAARGGSAEIFFTTTLDRAPEFIGRMEALAGAAGYGPGDIGAYLQPQNMGTCHHVEFVIPYSPADASETARARRLYAEASEEFSRMGAYYLRPHGMWARLQLNKDAQSTMILKRIKGIFDPNDIMNTGKLGLQGASHGIG